METKAADKASSSRLPLASKKPWKEDGSGIVLFKPATNRDAVGVTVCNGRMYAGIFRKSEVLKVFGEFERHWRADGGSLPAGGCAILHTYGGMAHFHSFKPIPGALSRRIREDANKSAGAFIEAGSAYDD